jgi:hypothetical protein
MPDAVDSTVLDSGPWILIFAHPGHELRAFHLMERVHPAVAVLTDGSGSTASPRLADSRALLASVGAAPIEPFGALSDRDAYGALMAGDAGPFLRQVDVLAAALAAVGARAVVADAAEGYNPVHDVCHWIARAAARRARAAGVPAAIFELDLVAHPSGPGEGVRLELDDQAFGRKLEATSRYGPLKEEVEAAIERYGADAFRVEFLRRVGDAGPPPPAWIPYYEEVGEARVRAGVYSTVLRYGAHVRPVIHRLLEAVEPAHHAADLRPLHE